ncbi:hypothetical protein [Pedobacter sp. UYP30]|uniref:hypothetical protein n=1 Tax=Pedobacter sp. UYP30 TaxID=1756400 RepID=UPI003394262C
MNKQELNKMLPHGYRQKIADKLGVHRNTVRNCLSGKIDSPDMEIAVLEVIAELKDKRNDLINRIQS